MMPTVNCERCLFQSCWVWLLVLSIGLVVGTPTNGQDASPNVKQLAAMRDQIKTVKVSIGPSDRLVSAELRAEPAFRYSDGVRKFSDATVWVWEVDHRPVAISKLERISATGTNNAGWQYCFASVTDQLVTAIWSDRFEWRAREPGLKWQTVPQGPASRETEAARLIQLRQIARKFHGSIDNPAANQHEIMRLLPTPLLRYSDAATGLQDGALFGLTSNGTNPDALLLVELRRAENGGEQWQYALRGLTGDAVEVRLDDKVIHSQRYTGKPGNYGTWMWIVFYDDGGVEP